MGKSEPSQIGRGQGVFVPATWVSALILGSILLCVGGEAAGPEPEVLTKAGAIRRLSSQEADEGRRARLRGVVTLADARRRLMTVQDDTGGLFVVTEMDIGRWRAGEVVEVEARVAQGTHLPFLQAVEIRSLGMGTLPPGKKVRLADLATDAEDSNWIEVEGVVRAAAKNDGRLNLEIVDGGQRIRVAVANQGSKDEDIDKWIDSEVRVEGVCGMLASSGRCLLDLNTPDETNITRRVERPKEEVPLQTIAEVKRGLGNREHRVRVKGRVSSQPDGTIGVTDPSGSIAVSPRQEVRVRGDEPGEAWGFVTKDGTGLEEAEVWLLGLSWPKTPEREARPQGEWLPIMEKAVEIRRLSPPEADRGYPARLRGVVTYVDEAWGFLFLQDESGILVRLGPENPKIRAGMAVEADGHSGSGDYAPILREARLRIVGETGLPKAEERGVLMLLTGREDSQRVEVRGVVRSVHPESPHLAMRLETPQGALAVRIPWPADQKAPMNLIDAEVAVPGVCGSFDNSRRQLGGVGLWVNALAEIKILRPAPADPFSLKQEPVRDLLKFAVGAPMRHRTRVRGVVTYRDPGWYTLFLQEGGEGLYARLVVKPEVDVGDEAEVVGFVMPGAHRPTMEEAIAKRIARAQAPVARPVTISEALSGSYDAGLITIDARLVDRAPETGGHVLLMQAGEWTFRAILEGSQDPGHLKRIKMGSTLRITGVCSLQATDRGTGQALWVQMRTPNDVAVIAQPPLLTTHQMLGALGVGGGILLATAAWSVMLRRRVKEQTALIRSKIERETALEARYRDLFEHATDLVYAHDLDGTIQDINAAGERMLGFRREELRGQSLSVALPPDQMERARQVIQRLLTTRGQVTHEIHAVSKDGRKVSLEVSSWLVEQAGKPVGVQGIARDVTERIRVGKLLQEREEHFRSLIENAIDLISIVREDGVIAFQSPSAKRVLGFQPEDLVGRNVFDFLHPEDQRSIAVALKRAQQEPAMPKTEICRFRHKDGGWRLLEGAGRLLPPDAEGRKQVVVNLHDITEQKHLEDQLRQAQKMEAIGQLAGGVAHDFNNILTAMLMHLGLLQEEPQLAPEIKASLTEIEISANRAANLTRQLLLFGRRQVMQMKPVDINEVVDNLLKMLRRLLGENVALEFRGKANLPLIEADGGMLEQMVMNLSVNARDAMPQGGRLTITTSLVDVDPKTAENNPEARPGRFVCLNVSDTGTGMDEATLKRIFEPFFTTKDVGKGTGLGLATVYGIVKQHQGWPEVESVPGKGTAFRIFLPVSEAMARPPTPPSPDPAAHGGSETILLVEDERTVRQMVARCLQRNGYQVLEAANGTEALALWQEHRGRIDLLFTDMVMPEGVSGLDLALRLRADKEGLKTIISSGYSLEISTTGAPRDDQITFLAKPYEIAALALAVRTCLDKP